ncbi:RNA polymerase II transcriptional coactivator KIWI-like [Aristolochia californica]|uniref:RNA polymerase II transcriptional coactivator KIWI-like n=1 Tax=Aristolochia californica TaxID=171875 RepID=UPI0035DFE36E
MPRWGKRKDNDDTAKGSGHSDDETHPRKAAKKGSEDTDTITVCEISKNRKVSVRSWQGKIMVDIREFNTKDGKEMPGKKGISLTLDQWNTLKDHVTEIDKAVAENE